MIEVGTEILGPEGLDELPEGSIACFAPFRGARLAAQKAEDKWCAVGGPDMQTSHGLAPESFPMLVLWIPDPGTWEWDE